jgi:hypothetical protein
LTPQTPGLKNAGGFLIKPIYNVTVKANNFHTRKTINESNPFQILPSGTDPLLRKSLGSVYTTQ